MSVWHVFLPEPLDLERQVKKNVLELSALADETLCLGIPWGFFLGETYRKMRNINGFPQKKWSTNSGGKRENDLQLVGKLCKLHIELTVYQVIFTVVSPMR